MHLLYQIWAQSHKAPLTYWWFNHSTWFNIFFDQFFSGGFCTKFEEDNALPMHFLDFSYVGSYWIRTAKLLKWDFSRKLKPNIAFFLSKIWGRVDFFVFGLAPTTDISLLLTGGMLAVSEIRLTGLVWKKKASQQIPRPSSYVAWSNYILCGVLGITTLHTKAVFNVSFSLLHV